MSIIIFFSFLFLLIRISYIPYNFFIIQASYYNLTLAHVSLIIKNLFAIKYFKAIVYQLFIFLLLLNLLGGIFFINSPIIIYLISLRISFIFFPPLIISSLSRFSREFISHLIPFGTPLALIPVLPLIEILRICLRPFTLAIRIRTNLARGHIILFIFRFFCTKSFFHSIYFFYSFLSTISIIRIIYFYFTSIYFCKFVKIIF